MVELCIHVANVFYLFSYLGRDMLWLRTLTCAGLVAGIAFFACQPTPLLGPLLWHIVFLIINALEIWRLVLCRRELKLSEEQERTAELVFRDFSREDLVNLLTQVMCKSPERIRDIRRPCQEALGPEEKALRTIAFGRLSRHELVNLLTRRLWHTMKTRVRGVRLPWRRRRNAAVISGD